jgi:hypothetical protein
VIVLRVKSTVNVTTNNFQQRKALISGFSMVFISGLQETRRKDKKKSIFLALIPALGATCATGWTVQAGRDNGIFAENSRLPVGPTQHPILCVPGFFSGINAAGT